MACPTLGSLPGATGMGIPWERPLDAGRGGWFVLHPKWEEMDLGQEEWCTGAGDLCSGEAERPLLWGPAGGSGQREQEWDLGQGECPGPEARAIYDAALIPELICMPLPPVLAVIPSTQPPPTPPPPSSSRTVLAECRSAQNQGGWGGAGRPGGRVKPNQATGPGCHWDSG